MLFSVTDFGGLNRITRLVLANAAHAIAGMVLHAAPSPIDLRPAIGVTALGVTTECAREVALKLRKGADCILFSAVPTGMASLQRLIADGLIDAVIDVTPTDVTRAVMTRSHEGVNARFAAIGAAALPYVGSGGGLDMMIFGGGASVPRELGTRKQHQHTSSVTLVRANADDSAAIGALLGRLVNSLPGPVHIAVPERGLSALSVEGGPFYNPEADIALLDALEAAIITGPGRTFERLPCSINDAVCAHALAAAASVRQSQDVLT